MSWQFTDVIYAFAALQFFLLVVFFFFYKQWSKSSQLLLAAFLLVKTFSIINHLIIDFDKFFTFPLPLFDFFLLYGPLLYFYTKSIVFRDFSFKKYYFLHFLPFIFSFFLNVAKLYLYRILPQVDFNNLENVFMAQMTIIRTFYFLQVLLYLVLSFAILRKYRDIIKKSFSYIKHINLTWLSFVLYGFLFIWIIDLGNYCLRLIRVGQSTALNMTGLFLIFIFANYLVLRALRYPEVFSVINERPKYKTSSLTKKDSNLYVKKLQYFMSQQKPYLHPELTISELAQELKIPSRHLSQVINEKLKQNFYDFVNSYRINEAKSRLIDPVNDTTIIEILFDVGFNSKSSFNRAFKKYTGTTPLKYKKTWQAH
jgi:AraC-like DNA-binding protein